MQCQQIPTEKKNKCTNTLKKETDTQTSKEKKKDIKIFRAMVPYHFLHAPTKSPLKSWCPLLHINLIIHKSYPFMCRKLKMPITWSNSLSQNTRYRQTLLYLQYIHLIRNYSSTYIHINILICMNHIYEFEHTLIHGGCTYGVIVKMLDFRIVASEFELQSRNYIHFRTINQGKVINPLILQAKG